jgi:hypothetical protein
MAIRVAALGLFWCVVGTALAQPAKPDEYKRSIEVAVREFEAGNWAEARVLFEQAHALKPSARTLRGMGMVSFELKQYVRAQKELNAALVELRSPLSEEQRHEVLSLLQRVEKFIGRLTVRVKPPEADTHITLDGSRVEGELKLDLGQHDLSIVATGYRALNRTVSIEGGKTVRLELTLAPVENRPQPTAASLEDASHPPGFIDTTQQPSRDRPSDSVFEQWWFWSIVGAVVVGGAVTAVALTAETTTESAVRGNTGLEIQVLTLGQ